MMTANEIAEQLKGYPAFKKWATEDLRQLAQNLEEKQYRKGDVIFQPGQYGEGAYIVAKGTVVQSLQGELPEPWHFRTLSEGDVFAEQALFRGETYTTKAVAETDVDLYWIEAEHMAWALTRHSDLWKHLTQPDVSARLRAIPLLRSLNDKQIELLAKSTTAVEFAPDKEVCRAADPEGCLWIVDWGQVEITEQAQIDLTGGKPSAQASSTAATNSQQSNLDMEPRLTAGNWFVGGLVKVRGLTSVSAKAVTKARLLKIPGHVVESMAEHFEDLYRLLVRGMPIEHWLNAYLKPIPQFNELTPDHLAHMATLTMSQHVPPGLDVIKQGEKSDSLYILVEGSAVLRSRDDEGRPTQHRYIVPGAYYGVEALLDAARQGATVRSTPLVDQATGQELPSSDWLVLQREDMLHMIEERPRLWKGTTLYQELKERPKKKRFEWLDEEETVEYFGRKHWLALAPWVALPLFLAFVATLVLSLTAIGEGIRLLTYTLVLVVFLVIFVTFPLIDYLNDYYAITNRRVTRRNRVIFVQENRVEALVERVENVTQSFGLIGRIFNYGTMDITTAAKSGAIEFKMVPEPQHVQDILFEQRRKARAGRQQEQREMMRDMLVERMEVGMPPKSPRRALPDTAKVSAPRNWPQRQWDRFAAGWRGVMAGIASIPDKTLQLLIKPLPEDRQKAIMDDRKKKRRRQKDEEQDKVIYRKHWLFLIRKTWLPGLLVLLALLLLFSNLILDGEIGIIGGGLQIVGWVLLAISLFWWFWGFENWRNDQYILTRSHIIDVEALPLGLAEKKRQATWDRVQNATYDLPTFWANLFDFGTVIVETAAVEGQFDFVNVGHPRLVQQEIFRRMDQARLEREAREQLDRRRDFSDALEIYDELTRGQTV